MKERRKGKDKERTEKERKGGTKQRKERRSESESGKEDTKQQSCRAESQRFGDRRSP